MQRANPRYPQHPPMPSQAAFRPAPGLGHVTAAGGNFSRFQTPQYPEETASVSSEKTYPAYPSQSDCLRNEIGEIAKSFSQIATQEIARIQDAIQAVQAEAPNPKLSQWCQTFETALHQAHDSANASMTLSLVQAEEQTQADLVGLRSAIENGMTALTAKMNSLIQDKAEAWKQFSAFSDNIEARVKKGKGKRRRKRPDPCACLLVAGRKMKKRERKAALASGALVCTCPPS